MGQAKIRRLEIEQLKRDNPKANRQMYVKTATAFGAFYHDDQPDGVGVFLDSAHEPSPGWVNTTFHTLKNLVLEEIQQMPIGTEAKRAAIEFRWTNLRQNITRYNLMIHGSPERNMTVVPHNVILTDELIEVFVNIITDIWILELCREIANDDYNGMVLHLV